MSANKFITKNDDEVGYYIQIFNCQERNYSSFIEDQA
jgi:hypothetical protein